MVNNWKLSWDRISPALKHKTKHLDETFKKTYQKIKHKNVNFYYKKSQLSEKSNKTVIFCYKNSQT